MKEGFVVYYVVALVSNMKDLIPLLTNFCCKLQPTLTTYVTAGYPTESETVNILFGMETGDAGSKSHRLQIDSVILMAW